MWAKGQPWRVVNSLQKLNEQIRAYAPRSIPPATSADAWGSIADDVHSAASDHYPHFYGALGPTAVVCARDFPHAPALGLDGHVVTEILRASRDGRIGYLIFDRRITGPNHGWQWQPYTGSDPHDTHFHVSSVHTAAADSTANWTLPGGAMPELTVQQIQMLDDADWRLDALTAMSPTVRGGRYAGQAVPLVAAVQSIQAKLDELLGRPGVPIDVSQLAAAIVAALPPGTVGQDDIVAALQSPSGQAALVQAANTAEDS